MKRDNVTELKKPETFVDDPLTDYENSLWLLPRLNVQPFTMSSRLKEISGYYGPC